MNFIHVPDDTYKLINALKNKYPSQKPLLDEIEGNTTQHLWHQLTENLIVFYSLPETQQGTDLIELYNGLVMFIEPALNPMKLLLLVQKMLANYKGRMTDALTFIKNLKAKIKFKGDQNLFILIIKGFCYFELGRKYDLEDLLKEVSSQFESRPEIDSFVYANFYKLATYFYEQQEKYDEFYTSAFQYLAYEKQITDEEKINLCFKMCIASLIGEKMFNFAELIEKSFFKLMLGSHYEWIYHLILSFNSAKVDQFLNMANTYSPQMNDNPVLRTKGEFLQMKIRIAALLDLIFQKNKNERTVLYKEISDRCLIQNDNIEYIVMKALSLGLIRGHIDQVEQKVIVNWIQPKYLDKEKLTLLKGRFDNWITKAGNVLTQFEDLGGPLIAS